MPRSKVRVIAPVYNAGKYVDECASGREVVARPHLLDGVPGTRVRAARRLLDTVTDNRQVRRVRRRLGRSG